jgi:hypothetical protein
MKVPAAAGEVSPTNAALGEVPVAVAPVQPKPTEVTEITPPVPPAVNAVSPLLCHVTAPAVDVRAAVIARSAVATTTARETRVLIVVTQSAG